MIDVETIKGQVSFEFLIVVCFFIVISLPIIIFAFNIMSEENWKVSAARNVDSLKVIATSANKLITLGEGSSTYVTVYFSTSVKKLASSGRALYIVEETPAGEIEQVIILDEKIKLSYYDETGSMKEGDISDVKGLQNFKISYQGGFLKIIKE